MEIGAGVVLLESIRSPFLIAAAATDRNGRYGELAHLMICNVWRVKLLGIQHWNFGRLLRNVIVARLKWRRI